MLRSIKRFLLLVILYLVFLFTGKRVHHFRLGNTEYHLAMDNFGREWDCSPIVGDDGIPYLFWFNDYCSKHDTKMAAIEYEERNKDLDSMMD